MSSSLLQKVSTFLWVRPSWTVSVDLSLAMYEHSAHRVPGRIDSSTRDLKALQGRLIQCCQMV
jgi:hypothetical protein